MNRTIALFVALVILLAHTLAIYTDGQGHFAFAYDPSYVALRLAMRRLVKQGAIPRDPVQEAVAAVSVGVSAGRLRWLWWMAVGTKYGHSTDAVTGSLTSARSWYSVSVSDFTRNTFVAFSRRCAGVKKVQFQIVITPTADLPNQFIQPL